MREYLIRRWIDLTTDPRPCRVSWYSCRLFHRERLNRATGNVLSFTLKDSGPVWESKVSIVDSKSVQKCSGNLERLFRLRVKLAFLWKEQHKRVRQGDQRQLVGIQVFQWLLRWVESDLEHSALIYGNVSRVRCLKVSRSSIDTRNPANEHLTTDER